MWPGLFWCRLRAGAAPAQTLPDPATSGACAGHPPAPTLAPVMVDSSVTYQLVSIPDAARILRLSESSIRRLIKAGRLEAERVQRPQGYAWLVKVPAPSTDPPEQPPRQVGASGATYPPEEPAPSTVAAQADAISGLVAATVGSLLGPLVSELAASRQQNERQAEQLVTQAESIGRLTAERDAAQASYASILAAQPVEPTADARMTVWARWAPLGLSLLAVVLALGLLIWLR